MSTNGQVYLLHSLLPEGLASVAFPVKYSFLDRRLFQEEGRPYLAQEERSRQSPQPLRPVGSSLSRGAERLLDPQPGDTRACSALWNAAPLTGTGKALSCHALESFPTWSRPRFLRQFDHRTGAFWIMPIRYQQSKGCAPDLAPLMPTKALSSLVAQLHLPTTPAARKEEASPCKKHLCVFSLCLLLLLLTLVCVFLSQTEMFLEL